MSELDENLISLIKEKLNIFSQHTFQDNIINQLKKESNETYRNLSHSFVSEFTTKTEYIQYSKIYFNRLNYFRENLYKRSKEKWKDVKICNNVIDMKGQVIIKY